MPGASGVIRKEDHQAVYAVPWGQIRHDPKFPMPTLTNLKVFPTDEYYRQSAVRAGRGLAAAAAGCQRLRLSANTRESRLVR